MRGVGIYFLNNAPLHIQARCIIRGTTLERADISDYEYAASN